MWKWSHSVMSDSLQPHELQHARPPCPSPSQWFHPTISSSSVIPFSSCLQSFPASRSFQMSQFFASGGQSIGASASASVLPVNIQDWFPLRLTFFGLPAVQGALKSLLQHHSSKASMSLLYSGKISTEYSMKKFQITKHLLSIQKVTFDCWR